MGCCSEAFEAGSQEPPLLRLGGAGRWALAPGWPRRARRGSAVQACAAWGNYRLFCALGHKGGMYIFRVFFWLICFLEISESWRLFDHILGCLGYIVHADWQVSEYKSVGIVVIRVLLVVHWESRQARSGNEGIKFGPSSFQNHGRDAFAQKSVDVVDITNRSSAFRVWWVGVKCHRQQRAMGMSQTWYDLYHNYHVSAGWRMEWTWTFRICATVEKGFSMFEPVSAPSSTGRAKVSHSWSDSPEQKWRALQLVAEPWAVGATDWDVSFGRPKTSLKKWLWSKYGGVFIGAVRERDMHTTQTWRTTNS